MSAPNDDGGGDTSNDGAGGGQTGGRGEMRFGATGGINSFLEGIPRRRTAREVRPPERGGHRQR